MHVLNRKKLKIVKYIAISLTIAVIITNLIFEIVTVDGISMVPTLQNNDKLILEKIPKRILFVKRNDIVVVMYPADIRQRLIKRVVAVGGDRVKISNNITYINGKIINEYYKNKSSIRDYDEVLVPQDSIFVMGDNRTFSKDSRSSDIGFVKLNLLEGKVVIRLYPFNKMGRIR